MNFKKRFLAFCMLLSLSCIMPEMPVLNTVNSVTQTTSVAQAKKKTTKKNAKKVKKNKAKSKSTKAKKEEQVYVTATGSCYHTHACGNGTFYKTSLSKAKASGLRACKKCY